MLPELQRVAALLVLLASYQSSRIKKFDARQAGIELACVGARKHEAVHPLVPKSMNRGTAANCLSKPGMGVDLYYSPASRDCPLPFQVPAKLVDFPLKLAIRDFSANGRVGAAQPIP